MDSSKTIAHRLGRAAAAVPGTLLAGTFGTVARLRRRPLHPDGHVQDATVRRTGLDHPTGVPWVDEPGVDQVLVRFSRATGLPGPLPDVHGMALRVPTPDGRHGDVLLASTGLGRFSRFVLAPTRRPTGRACSTLLPYRTESGPLLLAAVPQDEHEYALVCSSLTGTWRRFATLEVSPPRPRDGADAPVAFDPVTNQLPGLAYYPWAAELREGSYRASRRARDDNRVHP